MGAAVGRLASRASGYHWWRQLKRGGGESGVAGGVDGVDGLGEVAVASSGRRGQREGQGQGLGWKRTNGDR